MTKEQINGAIRAILTLVGTYVFGHNIFGTKVDASIWQEVTGALMVVTSFAWSIATKELTLEIFQSTILKVIMVGGALFVSSGKIKGETLAAWVGALTAILPILYSFLSKKKSEKVDSGTIPTEKLSK